MGSVSIDKSYKEKLIRNVKKEVKQIMEEAVTKKFVHEDSGSITSLCAAVEVCVSHGLKRRALGLFKSSSTTALLHKVAKSYQPAATVVQLVAEVENCDPNKRSSSGSESASKLGVIVGKPPLQKKNSVASIKYLWIRLALIEKQLAKIVDYIVLNSNKFYEKDALVADPDYGSILSSLLVGPCALDFSKIRTSEYCWRDPPADELVQRHRISSGQFPTPASPPAHKRPGLHYKGSIGFSNSDDNMRSKDYVESLHQNSKSTLLYGKNNVLVFIKDGTQPLAGYLSLHQYGDALNLKWTPNQLMNGCHSASTVTDPFDKNTYWEHALNVVVHEIVYVHCHQGKDSDWIVLVGQDGVQRPPIHFPRGGHLLAFLSCLENGLLPHGMLDPPLWSQRGKEVPPFTEMCQNALIAISGKVFPKLRRKGSTRFPEGDEPPVGDPKDTKDPKDKDDPQGPPPQESNGSNNDSSANNAADFVFRIVYPNYTRNNNNAMPQDDQFEYPVWQSPLSTPKSSIPPTTPRSTPLHSVSTTSSTSSSRSLDQQTSLSVQEQQGEPIQIVCQSMRKQIISRAFYGWLAHCRHLRTVRTHLVGLVYPEIVKPDEPSDATGGLTEEVWEQIMANKESFDIKEIYRLVYFGGMQHSLRKKLWPILLSGKLEDGYLDQANMDKLRREYEDRMSEWLAVEAIVRQKDRETMAANLAKLSSETTTGSTSIQEPPPIPPVPSALQTHESNEVFEENPPPPPSPSPNKNILKNNNDDNGNIKEEEEEEEVNDANANKDQEDNGNVEDDSDNSGHSSPVSSSRGGIYSQELLDTFGLNIHRIDKDVKRCDRNYYYFTTEVNLDKLRNVMCTYVWEHIEMGYVQGMCDLAAPLLVILDDEALAYGCFRKLMERMSSNFPSGGGAMDSHFANMRSLLQILDHDLFSLIRQNGDYTHFYFCYRWFLLDFKREFCYDDVFLVWETIWAARQLVSSEYMLFLALALLTYYRDIILSNSMDFTDIIKFFNEMAERHDAKVILQIARNLVLQLQTLIDNK